MYGMEAYAHVATAHLKTEHRKLKFQKATYLVMCANAQYAVARSVRGTKVYRTAAKTWFAPPHWAMSSMKNGVQTRPGSRLNVRSPVSELAPASSINTHTEDGKA